MAEIEIRPFRAEDVDPAYELRVECENDLFGEPEMTRGMFSNLLTVTDASWTAETSAGFAGSTHRRADFVDVLVRPSERRRGIGTQLLRVVEESAGTDLLRHLSGFGAIAAAVLELDHRVLALA